MIYRTNGKKWTLPEKLRYSRYEEGKFIMKPERYNVLGYRQPNEGEYFLSGAIVEAYRAKHTLSQKYLVVEFIKEES